MWSELCWRLILNLGASGLFQVISSYFLTNPCQVSVLKWWSTDHSHQNQGLGGGRGGWCPGITCLKFKFLISDLLNQSLRRESWSLNFCQVPQMALTCTCYNLRIIYFGNCTSIILFWLFPQVYVGVKVTRKYGNLFYTRHPGYTSRICQLYATFISLGTWVSFLVPQFPYLYCG